MLLQRTDKARQELRPGNRNLNQRERTVLLLADGRTELAAFRALFDGQGEAVAHALLAAGFLEVVGGAPQPAPPPPAPVAATGADTFIGKRSLATTRMFLFDLGERMFARRDPALADRLREMLRSAKDRDAMLAASREMIGEIERVAGPERADSISERIAMMLPPETEAEGA